MTATCRSRTKSSATRRPSLDGPLVGVPVGGHGSHGEEAASPARVWALRAGLFVAGAAVAWFVARAVNWVLGQFFKGFNRTFDVTTRGYGGVVRVLLFVAPLVLIVYAGLMGLTYLGFRTVPVGFIPEQDKGYLVVNAQLPDGASLERTEEVVARLRAVALDTPGVAHAISVPGYSILTSTNIPKFG